MPITREQYSRRATQPIAVAVAMGLQRLILAQRFTGAGGIGTIAFDEVFEEWPSVEDWNLANAACVLPFELVYGDEYPTPTLLEDTWEPKGDYGFGLYVLSDASAEAIDVELRAPTKAERDALLMGLEGMFGAPRPTLQQPESARSGVTMILDEYFGLPARVYRLKSAILDDADRAIRNAWEARVTLAVQTKQVVLDPVAPLKIRFEETVEEGP